MKQYYKEFNDKGYWIWEVDVETNESSVIHKSCDGEMMYKDTQIISITEEDAFIEMV